MEIDKKRIAEDYRDGAGLDLICKKYHIGKIKAKDIIREFGVEIRGKSSFRKKREFVVPDWRIEKYKHVDGFHYVAKAKDSDFVTDDYMNNGGYLTSYIKNLGVYIPALYERRLYYQQTGNYWWELWFDIVLEKDKETKTCPYCGWKTVDVDNKSGVFVQHLKNEHGKSIDDYLVDYPDDIDYFKKHKKEKEKESLLEKKENYVICPICNEKFKTLTWTHINTHGISNDEFRKKYPDVQLLSYNMKKQFNEAASLGRLSVSKDRFVSKYEREIQDFLTENNVYFECNRQVLIGKEIDILMPEKKLGIEFNGLKWHTEWFGKKSHRYHLNKTIECNKKGYGLIHIFEDEYVNHKDIVLSKLSHIIGLDENKPKIMGRKCDIKEIYMHEAKEFLERYHIQGHSSSTVYLGAFHDGKLVAVMCFKNGNVKNDCWELTRFASDYNYVFQGIGGKLFKYFVKNYEPTKIISFADRRWTVNSDNNLYTKLGFVLEKTTATDYRYYIDESKCGKKYQRIHKMSFSKKSLIKKYGFPSEMTETEMARELGYDRIWDCGLFKYVWEKPCS